MTTNYSHYNGGGRERFDHHNNNNNNNNNNNINNKQGHDKPAFSRVFVVCGKQHTTDNLREVFGKNGTIEDIWVVKDRATKENRGLAYIKFAKMSEACLAIEQMNGKRLNEDDSGPTLKVIMAQPKSSKSKEDLDDDTALTRLFVLVSKTTEESELREAFQEFGEIEYVNVVKDRATGEKKGFGYVKFHRAYDAAKAMEEADKTYKAVMAEPKSVAKKKREMTGSDVGAGGTLGNNSEWGFGASKRGLESGGGGSVHAPMVSSFGGFDDGHVMRTPTISNRLQVNCSPSLSSEQIARLFDLIPGMELCDLKKNFSTGESKGIAIVVYNSVGSATYAKEKLNGFEYPPGYKLIVRYAPDGDVTDTVVPTPHTNDSTVSGRQGSIGATPRCSVSLPAPQPLSDAKTDECVERLFVVCQPAPPPSSVLLDVFCRFGNLIDVFMLKNKNFGYAKYSTSESAEKALECLHGAEVCGAKLKVLTAEPPKSSESARKRPRT